MNRDTHNKNTTYNATTFTTAVMSSKLLLLNEDSVTASVTLDG